jgi:hypothetical protein
MEEEITRERNRFQRTNRRRTRIIKGEYWIGDEK